MAVDDNQENVSYNHQDVSNVLTRWSSKRTNLNINVLWHSLLVEFQYNNIVKQPLSHMYVQGWEASPSRASSSPTPVGGSSSGDGGSHHNTEEGQEGANGCSSEVSNDWTGASAFCCITFFDVPNEWAPCLDCVYNFFRTRFRPSGIGINNDRSFE